MRIREVPTKSQIPQYSSIENSMISGLSGRRGNGQQQPASANEAVEYSTDRYLTIGQKHTTKPHETHCATPQLLMRKTKEKLPQKNAQYGLIVSFFREW